MSGTSKHTGILTVGNNAIQTGKGILTGLSITAAAADVTVTIYDNTAGSGDVALKYILDINVEGLSTYLQLPEVKCDTGIYAVVAGVGAEVVLHYK